MKNTLREDLYETILDILKQAVPGGWHQLKLYGEADDEQCYSFFYVWKEAGAAPVNSDELPKTGLDPELLEDLMDELDDCLISLWEESQEPGGTPWTTLTLTVDGSGAHQLETEKSDLSKGSLESRRKAWEKIHLK